MRRVTIVRWQQTQGKYVGIMEDLQRFNQNTLQSRPVGKKATVLVGELAGSYEKEWYCISFPRDEYEFDEVREMARSIVEEENQLRAAGKPSLTGK